MKTLEGGHSVCKFLEVSSLSFLPKYGLKMKEGYVMVKHLANTAKGDAGGGSCLCNWFSCCNGNWLKVWAVLKPGFMALLEDPFKTKPLDVIAFDVFPTLIGNNGESCVYLARETKEKNPLRFGFEMHQVIDPVEDASYKNVWVATAKANTEIYHEVFACIPNDSITSRAAVRQTVSYWKEKLGHTTIDLGIAPKKLVVSYQNDEKKEIDPMERLQSVKGHLVCFPLEFMSQEDLRPFFNETEFYAAQEVFH